MPHDANNPASESQATRRVKYSLNVMVAAVAAVAIVVLINWIAYRQFVRFDLTATRRYSLSPQTVNLLNDLKGDYRFVTLFNRSGPYVDQARDLVEEYQRYGGQSLAVEHINPGRDLGRTEVFFESLLARHEEKLGPLDAAITAGRETLVQLRQDATGMLQPLRQVLEDPGLTDENLKRLVQSIAQQLARFDTDIETVDKQIAHILDQPLPQYSSATTAMESLLGSFNEGFYAPAIGQFRQAGRADTTAPSVADGLLKTVAHLKRSQQKINETLAVLRNVEPVEDYDKLVGQLEDPETLVLIGPAQIRVIGLTEMFREPDPNTLVPGQQPQLRFQGEEKITGALLSMSLDHRPMVVFVTAGQNQPLGPRGSFQHVAQRLRNVNFQVEQWSPLPQPGPMGQPMPPGPPPEPQPGQKTVWIVLPDEAPNPMNPMGAGATQQVVEQVQKRLNEGDNAMVMLAVAPMNQFATVDPMAEMIKPWGITPQLDRLILRQITLPNNQTRAVRQLDIVRWPDELPITRTLAGMPGVFAYASPLVLGAGGEGSQDVKTWPLVRIQSDDIWAHRDLNSQVEPKLDSVTAGQPFVIGAAAERGDGRMVVFGDPVWASDEVTQFGPQGLPAEIFGAAFPGNAELFVNSVYWLLDLDQLIAASARTQDIRRIGAITKTEEIALKWALLAGMPLIIVGVGVGVWMVRQRG